MTGGTVSGGSRVWLEYELVLADGQVIEASEPGDPQSLVIGGGELAEGLERRLLGLAAGAEASFSISAGESVFGAYEEQRIHTLPGQDFAREMAIEPGRVVSFELPNGDEVLGTIRSVDGDRVTVDFNHPLIGRDFVFRIKLVAVDEMTEPD